MPKTDKKLYYIDKNQWGQLDFVELLLGLDSLHINSNQQHHQMQIHHPKFALNQIVWSKITGFHQQVHRFHVKKHIHLPLICWLSSVSMFRYLFLINILQSNLSKSFKAPRPINIKGTNVYLTWFIYDKEQNMSFITLHVTAIVIHVSSNQCIQKTLCAKIFWAPGTMLALYLV